MMTIESSNPGRERWIPVRVQKLLGSLAVAMLLCFPRTGASAEEPQACLLQNGWQLIYGASHPEVFDAFVDILNANPADPWTYVLDENHNTYYTSGGGIQYSRFATLYSDQSGVTSSHRPTYAVVCCPGGSFPEAPYSNCRSYQWIAAASAKQSDQRCPSLRHPVSLASGNKFLLQRDIQSGPIDFSRTYNSLSTRTGYTELITGSPSGVMPLGIGWTFDYQQQIRLPSGSTTTAWSIRAGGRVLTFQLSGSMWDPEADVSDRLIELKNSSGVRTGWRYWDAAEERAETFDASGKLQSVRERDGAVRMVTYSDGTDGSVSGNGGFVLDASGNPTTTVLPAGRLLRVQDSQGQTFTFGHDASSRIVKVTNSAAQSVRHGYDAANQLTTVTYPDSTVRTYHYNEATHTGGANLPGALTGITDENGARFATYQYNSDGRAIGESLAGGADAATLAYTQNINRNVTQTMVTDALGTARTYSFATQFGVTRSTGVSQPGGPGCGAASSAITYDGNANVASRTDFAGNKTCYGNDLARNLETVRVEGLGAADACPATPAGYSPTATQRRISTEWHPLWRLKVREAQPKNITTWVYHGQPDPTAGGAIASCAPSDAYVYDTVPIAVLCKQVEQATTDGTGGAGFGAEATGTPRTWTYTWNRHGQMLTANGPRTDVADITTYEYYPDTTASWTKGDLKKITNALGHAWSFTRYDAAGRLLSITDPNGVVTTQTWHPRGWLKSRSVGYALESWSYHPTGLLKQYIPPAGNNLYYSYEYDEAHRLKSITDPVGKRIEYTLDAAGNVEQVDLLGADLTLARQSRTEYDTLGRAWKRRDASGNVTEYQHDAMGRLNRLIDAKNRTTDFRWDALGRLDEITDAQSPERGKTQVFHDGQDHPTGVTAPNEASTQFVVNGLGDVTQEVNADRGTLTYTYDAAGNVTQRTDGLGRVTEYDWDALNRPTAIKYRPSVGAAISETVTYIWDSGPMCAYGKGRLCRVIDAGGTTDYSYSLFGHFESERRTEAGTASQAVYWKDAQGHIMSTADAAGFRVFPTRTGDGNIAWLDLEDSQTGEWLPSTMTLHTYDAAGQITGAVFGPWGGQLGYFHTYDLDGRPTERVLASYVPVMGATWVSIYAPVGESVEVSVTLRPDEIRGTLLMCRDANHNDPCEGEALLGQVPVDGAGTYVLQSFDWLALGIHNASVRFVGAPPFTSRYLPAQRPIFIGIPPTSLVDDLLH
jgi:YD repeat-containing protein